jgi:ACS family tartrate transporter-like MFS transporter
MENQVSTRPLNGTNDSEDVVANRTRKKIFRRIVPFVFLLYVVAYLDRANVAFAKLTMAADLGFSEAVYGLGAGIFFIGYLLMEIPGAIIVERWSARLWMARILITWGLCTILVGFVHTSSQFYISRTLLGVAEGGFFPGIVVYLSHWFYTSDRAKAMAGFTMAAPASLVFGAPLSAYIMRLNWFHLPGWRWVFILEGLPAILCGIMTLFYMTDHPRQAKWLAPEEREWMASRLEEDKKHKNKSNHVTIWKGLLQRNVVLMALTTCFGNIGIFAFVLWLPTTIRNDSGLSIFSSTVLSALPFACAMVSLYFFAKSSDRTGKRKLHTLVPFALAGVFFMISALPGLSFPVSFLFLCLTGSMAMSWGVTFWILPSLILGQSAAAATGLINIFSALGSFLGPYVVGNLLSQGYSYRTTVIFLSCCFFMSAALVSGIRMRQDQA